MYNIPVALRVQGPLNVEALRAALSALIARHETLRTTFATVDGVPVQRIHAAAPAVLHVRDLGEGTADPDIMPLLEKEARRPFDLTQGPLFRADVLSLGAGESVLLLNMHHIVSDGWSVRIMLEEMAAAYNACVTGRRDPWLEALPVQYADFSVWQREWLQGQVLDRQLGYWRAQLEGAPAVVTLPTDFPRPAAQRYRGSRQYWTLPMHLVRSLQLLSRQERCTLFMTMLAAFQVLLYRYTGQPDIVVGAPIANRTRREIEGLIGFFVNTLVLRTNLRHNPSFREVLRRVRETCINSYAHQDLPFEKLVEELEPARDLSHSPLFQVMFQVQARETASMPSFQDLHVERIMVDTKTAKFDLTMSLTETDTGMRGVLEYNTDLFEAATVTRVQGHYRTLLEGIVANPDRPIATLPLLTDPERDELLAEGRGVVTAGPPSSCVHELFEKQVRETPDAVAVEYRDSQLTYEELNARANQIARRLRQVGVGPEVPVALCVERSLDLVIGLLGILKAGGAYVPLDPGYPTARLEAMLQDSQAPILLTHSACLSTLPETSACVVRLDAEDAATRELLDGPPDSGVTGANLAYVIYTSGSTGRPKGVQITHLAVANFLEAMAEEPGFSAQDRMLAVTRLSFDIAGLELFLPLIRGAKVVIASDDEVHDGDALRTRMEELGSTVHQATPAGWRMLLESGWAGGQGCTKLCGGEALSPELAVRLLETGGGLWNMYGPTETTVWSTTSEINSDPALITLGRPIANTEVYLLDQRFSLCPTGVAGELFIGGAGLARGYLGRPDLTAERFVPHPFAVEGGTRLYRTGDLVQRRGNGALAFLGRLDHQVKIRGYRIELGEVESALRRSPAVAHAVVTAHEDRAGEKMLVAYYTVRDGFAPPSNEEVRSLVRDVLPEYMVPAAFVPLEAFPVTPSGKVDRKRLPAPQHSPVAEPHDVPASQNPVAMEIAEVWQEVLGVTEVGLRDNFLDLGGHSLLAIRVIDRLEHRFGFRLHPRDLFFQTVGQLASLCEEHMTQRRDGGSESPRGRSSSEEGFLGRLWKRLRLTGQDASSGSPRNPVARKARSTPRGRRAGEAEETHGGTS